MNVLSAKMATAEATFRFDPLNYRLGSMRVETEGHEHWEEILDERLEKIAEVHDLLDQKFAALRPRMEK